MLPHTGIAAAVMVLCVILVNLFYHKCYINFRYLVWYVTLYSPHTNPPLTNPPHTNPSHTVHQVSSHHSSSYQYISPILLRSIHLTPIFLISIHLTSIHLTPIHLTPTPDLEYGVIPFHIILNFTSRRLHLLRVRNDAL